MSSYTYCGDEDQLGSLSHTVTHIVSSLSALSHTSLLRMLYCSGAQVLNWPPASISVIRRVRTNPQHKSAVLRSLGRPQDSAPMHQSPYCCILSIQSLVHSTPTSGSSYRSLRQPTTGRLHRTTQILCFAPLAPQSASNPVHANLDPQDRIHTMSCSAMPRALSSTTTLPKSTHVRTISLPKRISWGAA